VPILQHGDFVVYETAAIVGYIDDAFDGPKLTPADPRQRAHVNQWISAINGYYYPYLIYHVSHERNVFPQLGIPSDEAVVAHAMPKVEVCLQVMERQLSNGEQFLLGRELSLADVYMLPRFVARINSRAQSAPCICIYERRTYSGRPSSSMRFSEATAIATSVVCRPLVRERSASPITRL
jgi:glutathione S-transferase